MIDLAIGRYIHFPHSSTGSHSFYYRRYHVVWATKYRYDVLRGELHLRIREIIRQVCREL